MCNVGVGATAPKSTDFALLPSQTMNGTHKMSLAAVQVHMGHQIGNVSIPDTEKLNIKVFFFSCLLFTVFGAYVTWPGLFWSQLQSVYGSRKT